MKKINEKQLNIISWVLMALSVIGNTFVNQKMVIGLIIWLVGSLGWVGYTIIKKEKALTILYIVYSILNIQGIIMWSR